MFGGFPTCATRMEEVMNSFLIYKLKPIMRLRSMQIILNLSIFNCSCIFHSLLHHAVFLGNANFFPGIKRGSIY